MLITQDKLPSDTNNKKRCIDEIYTYLKDPKQDKNLQLRCLYALDFFCTNSHISTILRTKEDRIVLCYLLKNLGLNAVEIAQKAPFFTQKLMPRLKYEADFPFKKIEEEEMDGEF